MLRFPAGFLAELDWGGAAIYGAKKPAFGPVILETEGPAVSDYFVSDCLREMYALWLDYRGDAPLPHRDRIDPLHFFKRLPNIMLVDVEGEGGETRFRVRLNGEVHIAIAGMSMAGLCFDEIPAVAKDEGQVILVFRNMLESPQPHYWRRKYMNPLLRWNSYERCLLPFTDDAGAVRTMMSVAERLVQEE